MLNEFSYEKMIHDFEAEFDANYSGKRRSLLFSALNHMNTNELNKTFIELLIRYNRYALPSVKQVISLAYSIAPEAMKKSDIEPYKLQVI